MRQAAVDAGAHDRDVTDDRSASERRYHRFQTTADLVAVTLVALALRLPSVGFGLPAMLHPDEPTNLAVGTRMADNGDWNPHFFSYPSLLFDVVALIDRADRLIVGQLLTPSGLTSQNMGIARTTDPGIVLSIRLVTLALSVGICMVVYGVFRRTTERRWTAVGCGLLAATSPLLVTNGVFITPDTYAAFFALVALVSALAVLRRGAPRDYVLAGLAIGFAAGSKYDVVSASPLVIAYALRQGRNMVRPRDLRLLLLAMAGVRASPPPSPPAVALLGLGVPHRPVARAPATWKIRPDDGDGRRSPDSRDHRGSRRSAPARRASSGRGCGMA